ncbi:hypothetical protein [Streptomyces sp. NBC_00286]|uniref:hypothetical protein n=1 Tax=Streptomyces sp. NBC_00286 TaxID=2975701 RepID=UPI003FA6DC3B
MRTGIVAITVIASSTASIGFGLDSVIEVSSAVAVLRQQPPSEAGRRCPAP